MLDGKPGAKTPSPDADGTEMRLYQQSNKLNNRQIQMPIELQASRKDGGKITERQKLFTKIDIPNNNEA